MSVCCAVCCEQFDEANKPCVLAKCRHVFHKKCIERCFQTLKKCPLCRVDYSLELKKFEILHLSYLPSANVTGNLLTEIEELRIKCDESNADKRDLIQELMETKSKLSEIKKSGDITIKEIQLKTLEILELCNKQKIFRQAQLSPSGFQILPVNPKNSLK